MDKKTSSAPALAVVVALLAAAGLLLAGGRSRPAARQVLSVVSEVAARAHSAPAQPTRAVVAAARPSAFSEVPPGDPGLVGGRSRGEAAATAVTAVTPGALPSGYGRVRAYTRAGRRYMAAVADPLAGIGPVPAGWTASSHTITVSGLTRVYLTVAPAHLTGSVPVVVLMHGVMMTAAQILDLTRLADQAGPAIIVAPQGWEQSWNAGGCCGPAYRAGIDDVGFIHAALQQVLAANPAADPARVYAVGFSNGGRMAYRLACDLPGVFTGFAAAEAVPMQACPVLHPLSILIIAQQTDPLLTVAADRPPKRMGGVAEPTVAAAVARERALDGCQGAPTVTYAGVAERSIWDCAAGTRFTYVWYPGGSHSWRAPFGATPGSTDMVLSLMGGQLVSGRSVHPVSLHTGTAPTGTLHGVAGGPDVATSGSDPPVAAGTAAVTGPATASSPAPAGAPAVTTPAPVTSRPAAADTAAPSRAQVPPDGTAATPTAGPAPTPASGSGSASPGSGSASPGSASPAGSAPPASGSAPAVTAG